MLGFYVNDSFLGDSERKQDFTDFVNFSKSYTQALIIFFYKEYVYKKTFFYET